MTDGRDQWDRSAQIESHSRQRGARRGFKPKAQASFAPYALKDNLAVNLLDAVSISRMWHLSSKRC